METEQILPHINANKKIKEALTLQLISSEPINILFIGDPASGKTSILKYMTQLKGKYCECSSNSPNFSSSSLMMGILSDIPLLCIDKIDRASIQEQHLIEEAIKSGLCVLAAAAPRLGRFDPYDLIGKQIDISPGLLNCFDLILPIKDLPNPEKDKQVAYSVLREDKVKISEDLRDMLKLHSDSVNPTLSEEALEELSQYYVSMRNSSEEGIFHIPITPRQLTSLRKLSKAAAKMRFSDIVSRDDAKKAIQLLDFCLNEIVRDRQSFSDLDEEEKKIMNFLHKYSSVRKDQKISLELIYSTMEKDGMNKEEVDETLEQLKGKGDIFEPKRGFVQIL